MPEDLHALEAGILACRICAGQFAATRTAHSPRPVFRCSRSARILITGQAPGARVHASGIFFSDASGDRLRDWLGLSHAEFYDLDRIAILPMAFCFPGYDNKGGDLPPPPVCAGTWRAEVLRQLPYISTTVLVGGYAQRWHLTDADRSVTNTVTCWRNWSPEYFPLPHPSWRNNALIRRIPGFEEELLPALRQRLRVLLRA
ncbi:MAG: uracil-DNA glycosylase family protein [Rhodobacteraceae bacterium]|nr:uracil-DNA glycosylase family protein [Paracoccaceae bacterium]